MSEERTLVKKLTKVMSDVKHIEKRGYNKFHHYAYATESDVAEKVREVLAEQSVIILPDVVEQTIREHVNAKGKTEYIATVKVKFTFIDGESGEELAIHSVGEGQDAGDKAVYKAITGAQKYALMKAFMIPTGDDPEADTNTDKSNDGNTNKQKNQNNSKASESQLNFLNKLIQGKVSDKYSYEDLHAHLKNKLETQNNVENFTKSEASKAIELLQDKQKAGA